MYARSDRGKIVKNQSTVSRTEARDKAENKNACVRSPPSIREHIHHVHIYIYIKSVLSYRLFFVLSPRAAIFESHDGVRIRMSFYFVHSFAKYLSNDSAWPPTNETRSAIVRNKKNEREEGRGEAPTTHHHSFVHDWLTNAKKNDWRFCVEFF